VKEVVDFWDLLWENSEIETIAQDIFFNLHTSIFETLNLLFEKSWWSSCQILSIGHVHCDVNSRHDRFRSSLHLVSTIFSCFPLLLKCGIPIHFPLHWLPSFLQSFKQVRYSQELHRCVFIQHFILCNGIVRKSYKSKYLPKYGAKVTLLHL